MPSKPMSTEEAQEWVAAQIRAAVAGAAGRAKDIDPVMLQNNIESAVASLVDRGAIAGAKVGRVTTFDLLPLEEQQHLLALYEVIQGMDTWSNEKFTLTAEEGRWLTTEVVRIPADVQRALREKYSDEQGLFEFSDARMALYWEELAVLESQYSVLVPRHPHGVTLVDWTFQPIYPVKYIKVTIALDDVEGAE